MLKISRFRVKIRFRVKDGVRHMDFGKFSGQGFGYQGDILTGTF